MSAAPSRSLTAAQDVLASFVNKVAALELPPLGPQFSAMSGTDLCDALVAHRITKKFSKPADADSQRRTASIAAMLAYDSAGPTKVPLLRDIPHDLRVILLQSREWLAVTLKDYKTSNTCRFPSGESHSGTHGWTDVINKLTNGVAWEVSLEAVPQAAAICFNNSQLKRFVKKRFWHGDNKFHHDRVQRWYAEAVAARVKPGFYVFQRMFLSLCNIVRTSRVTTVPKDNEVDRVITCEPFWNMVVQLSVAQDLRNSLKSTRGVWLETLQDLHRSLIANDNRATVDFSNASNSNWLCWLRFLWPEKVLNRILAARTGIFEYEEEGEVHYAPVRMLAPMGCGFTFEVMTLTLLAVSRVLDAGSTVFGDDVIIDRKAANKFVDVMSYLGWKINPKKSFFEGNFRESCGGFYSLADRHHIICYDFTWPTVLPDIFVAIQKIEDVLAAKQIGPVLSALCSSALVELLHNVPRDAIVEPQAHFSDDSVPTRLWHVFASEVKANPFIEILKTYQWDNPRLCSSYSYAMQNRPVRDDEHMASVLSSFYAMRCRETVVSRKKESRLQRRTCVNGSHTPLTSVVWASVLLRT